ncbi:MAG TPA: hypothetical protein VGI60_08375 [Chthoniobacterales bacterium]|jgi:hypothetical protein
MKTQLALGLLAAAVLSSCTTVKTTPTSATVTDSKGNAYAANPVTEPAPPAETDIPAEGPADLIANPALMPSPLLRASAAGGP